MEEERNEQIKSYESQMLKKLSSLTQLSSEDMDRFMEEHKKDLALYNGTCPYYTDTHTCTYTHVDIDMKKTFISETHQLQLYELNCHNG